MPCTVTATATSRNSVRGLISKTPSFPGRGFTNKSKNSPRPKSCRKPRQDLGLLIEQKELDHRQSSAPPMHECRSDSRCVRIALAGGDPPGIWRAPRRAVYRGVGRVTFQFGVATSHKNPFFCSRAV